MRKYKSKKIKLLLVLAILAILGVGIGYSVLTEKLDVESSVAINEMKWDIGFSSSEDNGGSILSESSISNNGKTLNVMCDFGSSTKQKDCTVKATITNNSTFDVGLTSDPSIVYDDTYIHSLTFKWNNHPTYENKTVLKDNFIAKGESEEVILTIKNKFINIDNLPSEDMVIPVTITLNFAEWQQDTLPTKNDLAVLKATSYGDTTAFRSATYKEKIKTITFEDEINVPGDAIESWDIGVSQNGNVMAYVVPNENDSTYYDLYIQSDTQLYANKYMGYWFYEFTNVDSINGLELLDTSSVTYTFSMFEKTGYNSTVLTLDVSNFDTSNVTSMASMFENTGYNSTVLTLDVSNFDTSNVTDMWYMFGCTGYSSNSFTLDVSNFDTSNVTDMRYMFYQTGYKSTIFTLDVSNFNTSNVTNMYRMFNYTGYNNPTFTLDVSNFDTSSVTNMSYMFNGTGYKSTIFTLDVSNFDTSKVTSMERMFYQTGYNSTIFTLDVSNFDTSKVTDMSYMFRNAGYSNPTFTLDVSNFNTSNVTNMSSMFEDTGYNSTVFTLDLSNFDTSKVTNMSNMFWGTGYKSTVFTLDVSNFNTSNVTDMSNMFRNTGYKSTVFTLDVSNFDTSKVTNMSSMFWGTGYNNPTFTLDVSNFDTSKVTEMYQMFFQTGYNSTKLNTSITIKNPNTTSYASMFSGVATKEGSQIIVNYTSETSDLVDRMIATKSSSSNVVKGTQIN